MYSINFKLTLVASLAVAAVAELAAEGSSSSFGAVVVVVAAAVAIVYVQSLATLFYF